MGTSWKLNGVELTNANVTVLPASFRSSVTVRQDRRKIHDGTEKRTRNGKELSSINVQFDFYGRGNLKYDELDDLLTIVEDEDVWTLEAPSDHIVYLWRNKKRAAMATETVNYSIEKGTQLLTVTISCIVDGIWIADGGSYFQEYNGNILRNTATNYDTDGGVADLTGRTVPTIKLPEQTAGYPRAVRESDFAVVQLPAPISTVLESGVNYAFYNMTGFLFPPLSADGAVGLFEVYSSPTANFLSGTT